MYRVEVEVEGKRRALTCHGTTELAARLAEVLQLAPGFTELQVVQDEQVQLTSEWSEQ